MLEYFISTHGARKGLADTALKTADSGYMTRKLVDVAQDVIISEDDCGTTNGIWVRSIYEGDEEVVDLGERIIGRVSCQTIVDPVDKKKKLVKANQQIDEQIAASLQRAGVEEVKIRSVLTCESKHGVCAMCYGRNLATGQFVKLGEAVGIIAAQSIGEPGTQLTMRTFHIGGTASQTFKQPMIKAKNDGHLQFNDLRMVQALDGSWIVLNKNGTIGVHNAEGRELERYNVVIGSVISEPDGAEVKKGETFVQWDPYNVPILSEKGGKIEVPRHDRGRHHEAGSRRSDGPEGHGHHRTQGRFASADRHCGREEGSPRQLLDSVGRARHRGGGREDSGRHACWRRRRAK